jgi:hypothetical protein
MALLSLVFLLLGVNFGFGGEASLPEYQVKALFLFNFAKYVDWPVDTFAEAATPFVIGMIGESKIGDNLRKAVDGKNVSGRPIVVRQIEKGEDLGKCQILFVSVSEKKRAGEIANQLKGRSVLTVGESEQFTQQGGVINFTKKEGKVRLEIDLGAARQARLQISSKLLSVADSVTGKL